MYYTVKQAAAKLCVSPALIYGWVTSGMLPCYRLGANGRRGAIRIAETDLEAFLSSMKQEGRQGLPPAPAPRTVTLKNLRLG